MLLPSSARPELSRRVALLKANAAPLILSLAEGCSSRPEAALYALDLYVLDRASSAALFEWNAHFPGCSSNNALS